MISSRSREINRFWRKTEKMVDVSSEQMCFNVQYPANPVNMATQFNVSPSPLVICNPFVAHRSRSPETLASRMELASLLARRELNRRGVTKSVTAKPNNSFKAHVYGQESNVTEPMLRPRPSTRPLGKCEQLKVKQTNTANVKSKAIKSIADASNIEQMSAEIRCLQENLCNQFQKLHSVMLRKDKLAVEREQWKMKEKLDREDEEMTRERQARRNSEQVARSTRILYQLQNKVCSAPLIVCACLLGRDGAKYFEKYLSKVQVH